MEKGKKTPVVFMFMLVIMIIVAGCEKNNSTDDTEPDYAELFDKVFDNLSCFPVHIATGEKWHIPTMAFILL